MLSIKKLAIFLLLDEMGGMDWSLLFADLYG